MRSLHLLNHTLPTLAENLALDEALLLTAETTGAEVLRLWEWPAPAVVLGAACCRLEDAAVARCQREGVPIVRRASGGGTVLLGPGCLLFSLVLSYDRAEELQEIRPSYRWILQHIAAGLAPWAPGLECADISDLAIAGRKVSGNSQKRKRAHLLHHGTLLYNFDLDMVERYLRLPARQPEYRQGRSHTDFLTNLNLDKAALLQAFSAAWPVVPSTLVLPEESLHALVQEKYSRAEWTQRR